MFEELIEKATYAYLDAEGYEPGKIDQEEFNRKKQSIKAAIQTVLKEMLLHQSAGDVHYEYIKTFATENNIPLT